ncbi:UDP-3-O-(3-hydroxymyristoyl) glucosamine N-acyltransferase [Roseivivax halodurans JCM 10272]|uniref:UDP-3-O-acylglucosamine N-acyltransferase n=1 Tax=Roseivivax halodurans JCM 10272 TaxID=1449350 RepID=X7EGT3_9RHOB|nr:UDP-3-O-(3-hydroxymyristoyl)glucosamine N-acyltransferase [Roseivivax halodurans]ETX14391.1 UDP-3-O-(3-hydroxymyristoyl) glucosamine N-acyltransferase [Roseivivax halodurans JCM 10272]
MTHTVAEIAHALGLEAAGDDSLEIDGVAEPADAGPRQLAMAMKPEYAEKLGQGRARAAMLWDGADWQGMALDAAILAPRPRYALSALSAMMDPGQGYTAGIHPMSSIDETAKLGRNVSVGPFSVIGPGVVIGDDSVIGPQVLVGQDTRIGEGALLHAGAKIGARCTIGARFIGHFNCVVGNDGFSFVTPEASGVEKARESLGDQGEAKGQPWARIASLGGVTIGDEVEVGAAAAIDRGTVRDTRIGNGTKIDNQVQVGHNTVVGEHTLLCGQVGIAGSVTIGDFVVLAGQVGVSDNIRIGDNVICGGSTIVLSSIPAGRVMLGYPAMKMDQHLEVYKALRRLPRMARDVAELRKAVSKPGSND